jgi:NADH-quinone oxidoreductase subunit N
VVQAVLFYGIGYIAMNMLAFGVLVYLTFQDHYCETLDDLKGIARKFPGAAAMMTIAMFSLAGLPPAVGFVGKVQIFMQLLEGKMYLTAVIALLFSLVALYFYINVIIVMYMKEPDKEIENVGKQSILPVWISLAISAIFVLVLGLLPSSLLRWSLKWAEMLF